MTPKTEQKMIFDRLSGPAGVRNLVAQAEQHRLTEQSLLAELPPSLQSGTRFVSCHEGELVLSADSGPKASQIRFRQHDIMAAARNLELFRFVWKLKVKVAPPRFQNKAIAKKL
ncbi:MAG TPA: DciA family protein, partial [Marinobacter sp.]|nr:DciA family protein [Marinobacter sp.]